jgi:D-glycero-D-manno-heptose 1,7-bisphosphate phosphatase
VASEPARGRPTVFLDRDGTLNREVGFVRSLQQLELLPGVVDAVQRLHRADYRIVVVTNQSGIARGLYDERALATIHAHLHAALGGVVAAWLHCPHLPTAEPANGYGHACACRKPQPGLLHQARELLGVTFVGGALIGDSARDLLMSKGLPLTTVLLHSGKPVAAERSALLAAGGHADHEAADLPAAVDWLLAR